MVQSVMYYRSPESVLEYQDTNRVKQKHGCNACDYRDRDIKCFEFSLCAINQTPCKRGYCKAWCLDDEWI